MISVKDSFLVRDLPNIDGIAENPIQMTPAERFSTNGILPAGFTEWGVPTQTVEFSLQIPNTTQLKVKAINFPNTLSLRLIDDQGSFMRDITDWCVSSHPHPLALGCRDLVTDAFAGDFTLE